jgi:hypothetical protein
VKRTDNGFEDRKGHQAPITLQKKLPEIKGSVGRADFLENGGRVRKVSGGQLGMDFDAINSDFESAAP